MFQNVVIHFAKHSEADPMIDAMNFAKHSEYAINSTLRVNVYEREIGPFRITLISNITNPLHTDHTDPSPCLLVTTEILRILKPDLIIKASTFTSSLDTASNDVYIDVFNEPDITEYPKPLTYLLQSTLGLKSGLISNHQSAIPHSSAPHPNNDATTLAQQAGSQNCAILFVQATNSQLLTEQMSKIIPFVLGSSQDKLNIDIDALTSGQIIQVKEQIQTLVLKLLEDTLGDSEYLATYVLNSERRAAIAFLSLSRQLDSIVAETSNIDDRTRVRKMLRTIYTSEVHLSTYGEKMLNLILNFQLSSQPESQNIAGSRYTLHISN